jgi:hypothetical protein
MSMTVHRRQTSVIVERKETKFVFFPCFLSTMMRDSITESELVTKHCELERDEKRRRKETRKEENVQSEKGGENEVVGRKKREGTKGRLGMEAN